MFARKDLERDVLSAYQQHSRNLKKASAGSTNPHHPRTVSIEALDTTGSVCLKSPTSDVDSAYTYFKVDPTAKDGRPGDMEGKIREQAEDMNEQGEAAAKTV